MIERFLNAVGNVKLSALVGWDLSDLLQVGFIILIMFFVYFRLIKNTASEKLVNGILFFLVLMWLLSEVLKAFNLLILSAFLKSLIIAVILSLVVIFQPELRRFMGYIGQKNIFQRNYFFNLNNKKFKETEVNVVREILEAIKHLKKTRTGALIVLQENDSAIAYTEVATRLDADVSTQLLLTIFHPNTPLHDGAIIIKDDKILAAGVLLPLTEDPKLSWRYGTRHRAAIGMSEVCDCACLVVSEETGEVSIAVGGTLKKYEDFTVLKTDLENFLGCSEDNMCKIPIIDLFTKKNRRENK